MSPSLYERLREEAHAMSGEIIGWRRALHRHPELSFKEVETTRFIVEKLREFGYEDIQTGFGPIETGAMTSIGKGERCVALRGDIDALPVEEKTGLDYASERPGVMHACGHDAHTANLLAVAKLLRMHEAQLKGRVKLIFQPAEETRVKIFEKPLSGAGYVVRSGAVDDVDAIFGMHVWSPFEKGKLFIKAGPTMMASGRFSLEVVGKSTHGASPNEGIDPITTACRIVDGIQTIVSREVDPREPRLITVGTIHGGTATNIVPESVTLSGTLRAARESVVRFMGERLGEVARGIAEASRCSTNYKLLINGPAVVNDPAMVEVVRKAARAVLGADCVCDVQMLPGSEDFREYSARIPAALYFMGMRTDDPESGRPHHSPQFCVNDEVLADSAAVMAATAMTYLSEHCGAAG